MIQPIIHILVTIILMIGAGFGAFFILRTIERSRKKDAHSLAEEMIRRARADAENFRREAELRLKEEEIKQKEQTEQQARKNRQTNLTESDSLIEDQDCHRQAADDLRKAKKKSLKPTNGD